MIQGYQLNANIYLTLLNSMDISTTPADRQTFVLPLQMIGDNEYDSFKTALHQVLCSYPDLKSIYVPFEDALLVIHVVASRFSFYSNGQLHNKNNNSMELIRKSLIAAAKDTSNYPNTVLTEGVRLPSIENQWNYETYMCEDELAVVNEIPSICIESQKKKNPVHMNRFYSLLELDATNTATKHYLQHHILILTEFLMYYDRKDINLFIDSPNKSINKDFNPSNWIAFSHANFVILQSRFIDAVLCDPNVIRISNNDPDDTIPHIFSLKECCNSCDQVCGKLPENTFLPSDRQIADGMNSECKSDYPLLSLGLRSIYHHSSLKSSHLIHIMLVPDNITYCVKSVYDARMKKAVIELPDNFKWDTITPLGFLIPNQSMNHTVLLKVWIWHNDTKKKWVLESKVYDSLCLSPKVGKMSYTFSKDNDAKVKVKSKNGCMKPTHDVNQKFYNAFFRKCFVPALTSAIRNDTNSPLSPKDIEAIDVTDTILTNSILFQLSENEYDNTCSLCSAISVLLSMNDVEPQDGVDVISEKFLNYIQFHEYVSCLLLNCAMRFIYMFGNKLSHVGVSEKSGVVKDQSEFMSCYHYLSVKSANLHITKKSVKDMLGDGLARNFNFLFESKSSCIQCSIYKKES